MEHFSKCSIFHNIFKYIKASEAKNAYKYLHFLASRDEINGIFMEKNWIFFLLYTILSATDFFALNDVIYVRTLRHINDDVA